MTPETSKAKDTKLFDYAAPLATVLVWSGNAIVTKLAASAIAPSSIAFYRWIVAMAILGPIVGPAAWRNRAAAAKVWWQLATAGLLGMVVYQCLSYEAARTTSAINIGILQALMPLMSIVLASLLSAEPLSRGRITGGLVSIAGLLYLVSRGDPRVLLDGGVHLGDALILVAVLANALYGVLLKRWAMQIPVWQQLFWQIVVAMIFLCPLWLLGPVSPITEANVGLVLYAGTFASLLSPVFWMTAVQRLGAARASMAVNLLPVVVALMAWPFLGERLEGFHYIGGGVALLGVVIALRD